MPEDILKMVTGDFFDSNEPDAEFCACPRFS